MRGLQGKTFLITGVSAVLSIGYATAERLIEEGASHIIITARKQVDLDIMIRSLDEKVCPKKTQVSGVLLDLKEKVSIDQTISDISTLLEGSKVDGLFNNAGVLSPTPVSELDYDLIANEVHVNFTGTVWFTRRMLPFMNHLNGSIVMCGSAASVAPLPGATVYCATKAALQQFVKVFALDMKIKNQTTNSSSKSNIRINAVSPGPVSTTVFDKLDFEADVLNSFIESVTERTALLRLGLVDEVAGSVAFLLSDDSSYITGTTLYVDGGLI